MVGYAIEEFGLSERQAYASSQTAATPVITKKFILGTDKYGRDILSRIVVGTRVSLSVGLITVIISLSSALAMAQRSREAPMPTPNTKLLSW